MTIQISDNSPTALSNGTEFSRIRAAWKRMGDNVAGVGDDAAIFSVGSEQCAITSDLSVEGTHFLPGWLSAEELGYRCAMASLSDLAAMAASPSGVLVSVGLSSELPEDYLAEVMAGVGEAACEVGARVWGGDTVRSERLIVDVTALGTLQGAAVKRSSAEPGDSLYVTGRLGGAAAAMKAWNMGAEPSASARRRFARPAARVNEASWLRDNGAKAMIDVSDGVVADAGHIAAASGVECVIALENLPLHDSCDTVHAAATSGEEYELLVTVSESAGELAERFSKEFDLEMTRIGKIDSGNGLRIEHHGQLVTDLSGFGHF